ncbi:MAG TPA: hypothetical protein PKK06_17830 [Phycisphaerae bacterium]|nr:hypothetical protein [Phycisphaerae bacterium]HNU47081.1 hypothetical protein [Phycisphaerae bacterium]
MLLLVGSVNWLTNPVFGADRDNLWLIEQLRAYQGTETLPNDADALLVPGFPGTDPEVSQIRKTDTPRCVLAAQPGPPFAAGVESW